MIFLHKRIQVIHSDTLSDQEDSRTISGLCDRPRNSEPLIDPFLLNLLLALDIANRIVPDQLREVKKKFAKPRKTLIIGAEEIEEEKADKLREYIDTYE